MTLYMAELPVADFAASVAWYRDALGMRVERADRPNQFALLRGDDGGRLALKAGPPSAGVRLHFRVPDLVAELARLAGAGVMSCTRRRRVPRATAGPPSPTRTGTPSRCFSGRGRPRPGNMVPPRPAALLSRPRHGPAPYPAPPRGSPRSMRTAGW